MLSQTLKADLLKKTLTVGGCVSTLRGEAPFTGYPSKLLELRPEGKEVELHTVVEKLHEANFQTVSVVGKPLRQMEGLSALVSLLPNKKFIIETSGRIHYDKELRPIMVPLVEKATFVITAKIMVRDDEMNEKYTWLRHFRIPNVYYKFTWIDNAVLTRTYIQEFFNHISKELPPLMEQGRIIVMPSDVSNIEECKDVWTFCSMYKFRYSARENVRLVQQ